MLKILQADAERPNPQFIEVSREADETNLEWINRNFPKDGNNTTLLLVGGKNPIDFRLRIAQAHIRDDLTPSSWSHAALLDARGKNLHSTPVHEISLYPPKGFGFPVPRNAEQQGALRRYASAEEFPNIALVHIPIKRAEIEATLNRYRHQRAVLDGVELLVMWLAFVWGVGKTDNPLLSGNGIPSAAMIEVVVSASGYELTPGLPSRATCPEAIWQAAKWWHEYYEKDKHGALAGAWCVTHRLIDDDDSMLRR